MKKIHLVAMAVVLILFTSLGWYIGQKNSHSLTLQKNIGVRTNSVPINASSNNGVVQDDSGKTVKYWYDPMVPNQKFDKPGKSPFMDMQLAPKYANEGSTGEDEGVTISSQTAQNLGIRLEKVEMKSFGESLAAVGRIVPDERRIVVVQTRIPGFVEKLAVRSVGDPVAKGQKVAEIYAPELLAAQQEYLALLTLSNIDNDNLLKQAARSRLKLLGMSEGEIAHITHSKKSSPRFGIYAPTSGFISELGVREGGQLMPGNSLMQISNLSQVWVVAEIPERDAPRIKPGMDADVQLQSLPGEIFRGKVSYLYPTLNEASRTLQVRIELPNRANRLRPGMYANIAFTGQVYEALSITTQSIIATGKRNIVIVKEVNGYRPVEVKTGQERDNRTEILSGLTAGEEVVVSGQFLIDSEASLSGVLTRLSGQDNPALNKSRMLTQNENMTPEKAPEKMPKGLGKVIEIDTKLNKVILAHQPIPELGWPSMTMGFKVKNSKELNKLKVGDTVNFDLKAEEPVKPGLPTQYAVEHLEKQTDSKGLMRGVKE